MDEFHFVTDEKDISEELFTLAGEMVGVDLMVLLGNETLLNIHTDR